MQIHTVILRYLQMELKSPFTTSFGTMKTRPVLLVEVVDEDGVCGWGEGVAFSAPWYTEETIETMWHMLETFLIPLLFQAPVYHPDELRDRFSIVRRNYMAKAALEGAVWDAFAKRHGVSLSSALGGEKRSESRRQHWHSTDNKYIKTDRTGACGRIPTYKNKN